VAVVVRNVDTNIDRRAATDETAAGNYELSAEATGFRKAVQQGIVLQVGQALRAELEVGSVTETVNVESSLVAINTENGSIPSANGFAPFAFGNSGGNILVGEGHNLAVARGGIPFAAPGEFCGERRDDAV